MKKPIVPLNAENLRFLVNKYAGDPVAFAKDICGFRKLDPWQEWYLMSSLTNGKGGKKIAIASCHSSGKTLLSSVLALHRLLCYPESRIKITSATKDQLKQAFGTTLKTVIEKSLISNWFDALEESITVPGLTGSWIRLQAWSIHKPEAFAGLHCESPCLIADEASAIDAEIFKSFDGSMMHPNSLTIMLGNPLRREGNLFDAFHDKSEFYETYEVSAHDSSFISKQWIKEMAVEYGEDSDTYRVRVLGQFPKTNIDTFIPEHLIKDAEGRVTPEDNSSPVLAGLDVGRSRDSSALVIRQGHRVLKVFEWNTRDTMKLCEYVGAMILRYNIKLVMVDENGIGAGVGDRLRQLHPGKILPVSLGNLPATEKEYKNKRVKWWGEAKRWLKYGSIPKGTELVKQGSSLLFTYDNHGRYVLESKDLAAKRGVKSPDLFDAFAYTFAAPETTWMHDEVEENNEVAIEWC